MHRNRQWILALVALLVAVVPALGAAASGEGGDGNIFTGDLGYIIWTLVVFGLVVLVLGKFAWGPILEGLQKREDFIHDSLEKARIDRDAAQEQLKKYDDKLTAARAEATAIVEEGRRDAEVLRQRIDEESRVEAEKMIDRAKREIAIAQETAVKELYTLSGTLATDIAARIVGRELKPKDHERLIEESISELEQQGPN